MSKVTENLKAHLDSISLEQFKKEWDEIKAMNLGGPSVTEFLSWQNKNTMNKIRLDKLESGSFFTSNVPNDINRVVAHNQHTSDVFNYTEKTIHELPSDVFVTPHFNTVKIADIEDACSDVQHNPPSHIVLEPGMYQHTCPNCGNVIKFTVPKITL